MKETYQIPAFLRTFVFYLGAVSIILASILLSYVLYLLFFPIDTIHYNKIQHVANAPLHPGDTLDLVIDYCKYNDYPLKIYGQLIAKTVETTAVKERLVPQGCHVYHSYLWNVPANAQPGYYHYEFIVEEQVSPIRTVISTGESDTFQVVK